MCCKHTNLSNFSNITFSTHIPITKTKMPLIPASSRVLDTPELLEEILHPLSRGDILVNASRVARFWHSTIFASPVIRKKLFLPNAMSQPIQPVAWDKWPHTACPVYPPTLRLNGLSPLINSRGIEDFRLNYRILPTRYHLGLDDGREQTDIVAPSCRSTYLTDPPCNTMLFHARCRKGVIPESHFTLYVREGITFADAEKARAQCLDGLLNVYSSRLSVGEFRGCIALQIDPNERTGDQYPRSDMCSATRPNFAAKWKAFRRWAEYHTQFRERWTDFEQRAKYDIRMRMCARGKKRMIVFSRTSMRKDAEL
jgi:hypothetical protein